MNDGREIETRSEKEGDVHKARGTRASDKERMNQQKEKSNKTENLSDVYGISLRLSAQAPTTRQPSQPPFHDHPFLVLGLVSLRCLAWTRLVTLHRIWVYVSPVRRWQRLSPIRRWLGLRFVLVLRGRTLHIGDITSRLGDHDAISVTLSRDE